MAERRRHYRRVLPAARLGTGHESLQSFIEAVSRERGEEPEAYDGRLGPNACGQTTGGDEERKEGKKEPLTMPDPKEFSLVVVLSRDARRTDEDEDEVGSGGAHPGPGRRRRNLSILLGKKLRGFGSNLYNCFGGKLEPSLGEMDDPAACAVRELREETGIDVPRSVMEDGRVGEINFTFEDDDTNRPMRVHLYCVFVSLSRKKEVPWRDRIDEETGAVFINPDTIRGCDEIEPHWFHDVRESVPFDEMFADDSVWLTRLLSHYEEEEEGEGKEEEEGNDDDDDDGDGGNNGNEGKEKKKKFEFDAWFHFRPGGAEVNTIAHHYLRIGGGEENDDADNGGPTTKSDAPAPTEKPKKKVTLERRLFHALHANDVHSPSIKEFKENWAMANAVRTYMKDKDGGGSGGGDINNGGSGRRSRMERVLDVAGGHGALAALFLLLVPECREAVVIDPAECASGKEGVEGAWGRFWREEGDEDEDDGSDGCGGGEGDARRKKKELRYRHECLRTGLRAELDQMLAEDGAERTSVTVVACHACQHLTDETLQIASEYGVNVAVMPCCQKDHDGWWKGLAKQLSKGGKGAPLSIGALMDLLAAGKMMGWDTGLAAGVGYRVKVKLMDESISQQNRMILCKAVSRDASADAAPGEGGARQVEERREAAHEKLMRAYRRAHRLTRKSSKRSEVEVVDEGTGIDDDVAEGGDEIDRRRRPWCLPSLLAGVCIGTACSLLVASQLRHRR